MDAAPGDDAVGGRLLAGHAEHRGAVFCEQADFLERLAVQQQVEPLARGQLLGLMLFPDAFLAAAGLSRARLWSSSLREGGSFVNRNETL